jgi:Trypsin
MYHFLNFSTGELKISSFSYTENVQILAACVHSSWAFSYSAPKFIKPRLPDTFKFKPVSLPPLDEDNDAEPTNNIVGGSLAKPGMMPYQCQLVIDSSYLCGGTLISLSYVTTAAHCASG